ncbi:Zn-ribbon domain-containing OB-fold protein [Sphingopyxis terrae]|uniref:Zn-ribbon domain-containing OB-fold protein n=1 Tax=Sphingopyxis terrae TaxID=33052 RepID=UPI0007870D2C|nr:zinc ribbon domain-containing protein [Sphingopyxis terrae]
MMHANDGADAPYWNGLAEGRLLLPRCRCGDWLWPAANHCAACGGEEIAWVDRPMRATIFSWTRTWHRFGLTESLDLPFVSIVATIDDCGIRLLGRLDDPDQLDPVIGEAIAGRSGATRVEGRDIPTIIWSRG